MVQVNSKKRARAMGETNKQSTLRTERENLIIEAGADYNKLLSVKADMEREIQSHKIYEDYLQTVVDSEPEKFKNINDMHTKFSLMFQTSSALTKRIETNIIQIEDIKSVMVQQINHHSCELSQLNNNLTRIHQRLEAAQNKSEKWERLLNTIQVQCGKKLIAFSKVRDNIWNIYVDICNRKKLEASLDRADFAKQLSFIKQTLSEFKRAIDFANREAVKVVSSMEPECS